MLRIVAVALAAALVLAVPAQADKVTSWRSSMSDSTAASHVIRTGEARPANAAANAYRPTDSELGLLRSERDEWGLTAVGQNPLVGRVTGRPGLSLPSTDMLIQWAAHKWGIPEDWIRAAMAQESWWQQGAAGDGGESKGISQIRYRPNDMHVGTEPLRWKSTAFALDYYGAWLRYFYDGRCSWCGSGYSGGQQWPSVTAWNFPGPPWPSADTWYTDEVQAKLAGRVWAQPGF